MTAEAAVLNLSAVALAADSAVTFGDKIHHTVNKLFTLSKYHPVGIMVYGSAEFCGIPYETIIKMYRKKLGSNSAGTIKEYVEGFREYISADSICTQNQQKKFVFIYMYFIFRRLAKQIRVGKPSAAPKIFKALLTSLKNLDTLEDFVDTKPKVLEKEYGDVIHRAIKEAFSGISLSRNNATILLEIAKHILIKKGVRSSPMHSGVVIAGFGENEIFPRLFEINVDGVVLNHLKWKVERIVEVDRDKMSAQIVPFAQDDMMWRFMEGVDKKYHEYLYDATKRMLDKFGVDIVKKYVPGSASKRETIFKNVAEAIKAGHDNFMSEAEEFRKENFVSPVTDVLVSLPKEELANLAEALVNLTSLKRRMSMDKETVGGPVDVAVISKGDGFVWLKRKHYFNAELNHHFIANYFK